MKTKILLFAVIFLAFLLRFYLLGKIPIAPNIDEVATAYNAYSIAKTARDEFGQLMPLSFRSYDDYKPPLLIYLTVTPVKLFGLSDWSIRLLPAILGTLSVTLLYFLVKNLLFSTKVSLLASLVLAISPWHLIFTRAAFESGIQSFLTILALLLFTLWQKRGRSVYFLTTAIILAASCYLYQASKVFAPALMILLIVFALSRKKQIVQIFSISVFFVLIISPIFLSTIFGTGKARLTGTSVFQDANVAIENTAQRQVDWQSGNNRFAVLFHNPALAYSGSILFGFFSHFRPDFLFLGKNGPYTNYLPDFGLLYLWEIPFLVVGLFVLSKSQNNFTKTIIPSIIILGILPAAITYGVPSSVRAAITLPGWQILDAIGIAYVFKLIINPKIKLLTLSALSLVTIYMLASFLHLYFVHDPIENSNNWYYQFRPITDFVKKKSNNYSQIIVSTSLPQSYEFFLYYLKYDPTTYLNEGGTKSGGFNEQGNHFGNFIFRKIDWQNDKKLRNALFVGLPKEFGFDAVVTQKVAFLDGKEAAYIVSIK